MSCVPTLEFPPIPDISPITLTPPLFALDLSVNFCCQIQIVGAVSFVPLGAAVLAIPGASAVILALQTALDAVETVINALPPKCPRTA
jgi:hypothetical protein